MTYVKVCGITRWEDAQACVELGVNLLGFNFFKRSPRYIAPEDAAAICDGLWRQYGTSCPVLVGVFVNEAVSNITAVVDKVGLDFAQLSGDESDATLKELFPKAYKAIQPMNTAQAYEDCRYFEPFFPHDERVPQILLDAYHPTLRGGTGETTTLDVAQAVLHVVPRVMLAGGLTPENVGERIALLRPWGVDVASGVESGQAGVKDHAKLHAFMQAVYGA